MYGGDCFSCLQVAVVIRVRMEEADVSANICQILSCGRETVMSLSILVL